MQSTRHVYAYQTSTYTTRPVSQNWQGHAPNPTTPSSSSGGGAFSKLRSKLSSQPQTHPSHAPPRTHAADPNRYQTEWSSRPYDAQSMQGAYFQNMRGGRVRARGQNEWRMPCDAVEQDRLNKQHQMLKLMLGKNYYGPLPEVLAARSATGQKKRILDIGTGTGIWAMEIAEQFPFAEVIGIDMVPVQTRRVPLNCSFEVCNVNDGLPFQDGTFDVIHVRFAQGGLISLRHLLTECSRLLRPSGLLLSITSDPLSPLPAPHPSTPSAATTLPPTASGIRALQSVWQSCGGAGGGAGGSGSGDGVFVEAVREVGGHGCGLSWGGGGVVRIPVGTWSSEKHMRNVGKMALANTLSYVQAAKAVLIDAGYGQAEVEGLAGAFVTDIERHRLYQNLYVYHARKGGY